MHQQSRLEQARSLLFEAIQLLQQQELQEVATTSAQQPPLEPEQGTLDVKEVAAYLRTSEWTIRDMVRTKSIPHFRLRSRIYFRKREIDHWVGEQQKVVRVQ